MASQVAMGAKCLGVSASSAWYKSHLRVALETSAPQTLEEVTYSVVSWYLPVLAVTAQVRT